MFTSFISQFVREEDGQDMVEYALLLAFIALGATALLGTIRTNLNTMWGNISNKIGNATTSAT